MRALITGITGQAGSYLADYLLGRGYDVIGMVRHTSTSSLSRIKHIEKELILVEGDLIDQSSIGEIIRKHKPDEIYNLGGQSFVPSSWNQPLFTMEVNACGVFRILEEIKVINRDIKFYQASSSEMFGKVRTSSQNEETSFYPRSPYAVSKVAAHMAAINYRESYGMQACAGICFNHESPRRGMEFVTRKITDGVARIIMGLQDKIYLGSIDSKRDWGHAEDYVRAMWMMLQQKQVDDYVIATGEAHSVREFCDCAFSLAGMNYLDYVVIDPSLIRPAEVELLCGDYSKIRNVLGWRPEHSFKSLVKDMVEADLARYNS